MDQKVQGNFQPNIQKPSDEQYFKYKLLVENELGLDWSKEKKYLLHGRLNARLFELGINYDQYYDLLINDQENKEKAYIWNKNWREKNRELSACYQRQYVKKRYKNDIQYKLTISLRTRLNRAIKNNQKTGSAVGELGCTIDEFKVYIENKFQEGMSWENWKHDGWHLDHIKPLSSFDLTDREQFLEACHYTNLQPLWGWQNMQKHDKINWKLN